MARVAGPDWDRRAADRNRACNICSHIHMRRTHTATWRPQHFMRTGSSFTPKNHKILVLACPKRPRHMHPKFYIWTETLLQWFFFFIILSRTWEDHWVLADLKPTVVNRWQPAWKTYRPNPTGCHLITPSLRVPHRPTMPPPSFAWALVVWALCFPSSRSRSWKLKRWNCDPYYIILVLEASIA